MPSTNLRSFWRSAEFIGSFLSGNQVLSLVQWVDAAAGQTDVAKIEHQQGEPFDRVPAGHRDFERGLPPECRDGFSGEVVRRQDRSRGYRVDKDPARSQLHRQRPGEL